MENNNRRKNSININLFGISVDVDIDETAKCIREEIDKSNERKREKKYLDEHYEYKKLNSSNN